MIKPMWAITLFVFVVTMFFHYGNSDHIEEKHDLNNRIYEIISQNFLIFICITLSLVLIFEKNIHKNIFDYISNFLPWKIVIEPKNDIRQNIPVEFRNNQIQYQQIPNQIPIQQQPININPIQDTISVLMNPSLIFTIMPFITFLFSEFVKIFALNDIKDSKQKSEKIDEITSNISNKSMKLLDDLQTKNFITNEFKNTTATIFVSCLNLVLPMICNEISNNKIHIFDQQQTDDQETNIPIQQTNHQRRIPFAQNNNCSIPQTMQDGQYYH